MKGISKKNSNVKIKLVYLMAASHSGSTLTAMLLGAHPEICTVGELKLNSIPDADNYLCSCRSKLSQCNFWSRVKREMQEKGHDFDMANAGTDFFWNATPYIRRLLRPLHRGRLLEQVRDVMLNLSPTWRENYARIIKRNQDLIESIATCAGVNVIVDSSKIGIRLKYLLRMPQIEVKVIRIIRDGRGVALAYTDPGRYADAKDPRLAGGGAGKTQEIARPIEAAAREWRRCNEEAESFVSLLGADQWIQIRYEDLCENPEKVLNQVCSFIGVKEQSSMNFREIEQHVIGNGMRLDSDAEIRLDERWRVELSQDDLEKFNAAAGDMNRQYGYL